MKASQKIMVFIVILGLLGLVYLLRPVLSPFLISILVAYLGDPLVDRLDKLGMNRNGSVIVVFSVLMLMITGLVLIFVPLLVREMASLVRDIPLYIEWIRSHTAPLFIDWFGIDPLQFDVDLLRDQLIDNWASAGGVVAQLFTELSRSGLALLGWFANIALIPVVSFYLLRDWDLLVERIRNLLPRQYLSQTSRLAGECDEVLGAFLRGQLLIMVILGCIYATGLWLVGLERSLMIGMIAGLASIVPYLGFVVGILVASLAGLFQFQEFTPLLYVFLVFGIGQIIEGMVLTPWLMGERIGLHPVAIIFAILAGGQLFGFVGILLALPVAAVVMVFLRHVHDLYTESELYEAVEEDN